MIGLCSVTNKVFANPPEEKLPFPSDNFLNEQIDSPTSESVKNVVRTRRDTSDLRDYDLNSSECVRYFKKNDIYSRKFVIQVAKMMELKNIKQLLQRYEDIFFELDKAWSKKSSRDRMLECINIIKNSPSNSINPPRRDTSDLKSDNLNLIKNNFRQLGCNSYIIKRLLFALDIPIPRNISRSPAQLNSFVNEMHTF